MNLVVVGVGSAALAAGAVLLREIRQKHIQTWLWSYLKRDWAHRKAPPGQTKHLLFCFVDLYSKS